MKKIFLFISFVCFIFLLGCANSMEIAVPDNQVVIEKNVILGESNNSLILYTPITLIDQEDIDELFENINFVKCKRENHVMLNIVGYCYRISWDDFSISIVNDEYFYYNGDLYEIVQGSFTSFLDEYSFDMIN